jgi:uncharacterized protein YkwD
VYTSTPTLHLRTLLAVALASVVAISIAVFPGTAHASTAPSLSAFDARLLHDINHARTARGIRALTVVAGTTDVAHHWSCHLASKMVLAHDLSLASQLDTHGSALWTTYGENVGLESTAYGADHLFHLYMGDAAHRANILDRAFRYVGIWTKRHNGRRFNTLDFVGSPVSSYSTGYGRTKVTC